MPQGWDLGVLGGGGGGQKFNFLNMVMWHIKWKDQDTQKKINIG